MSTLETNNISKYNGNNVSFNDPLKFKNLSTTDMNALSGMVAGDTIYNSTDGTLYVYNGTSWNAMSSSTFSFALSYLVIAGGGAGGHQHGGGGGAGGYRVAYQTDTSGGGGSTESTITVTPGANFTVTIGAGGAGVVGGGSSEFGSDGNEGNDSTFGSITSTGGGSGGQSFTFRFG